MADRLPSEWIRLDSRVVDVDYRTKTLRYVDLKADKSETLKYDALINTSPIDLFVEQTGICPSLNLEHNQVWLFLNLGG